MKKALFLALVIATGCEGAGTDEAQQDTLQGSLDNVAAGKWWGSSTLGAVMDSLEGSGFAKTTLNYQAGGSAIGEACMRSGKNSAGSCATLKSDAGSPYQVLAPMSRDFKDNSGLGECFDGSTPDGGTGGVCCPGERSNAIGLDGVKIWIIDAGTTVTNIDDGGTHFLKNLFCGNNDSDGGIFPTGCISSYKDPVSGVTFSAKVVDAGTTVEQVGLYRRNDSSGTTATFQSLAGCSNSLIASTASQEHAFCPGVVAVNDAVSSTVAPQMWWFDSAGGFHDAGTSGTCPNGSLATPCIGYLVAKGTNFMGYGGGSALNDGGGHFLDTAIEVNEIPGTVTNIRNLVSGGTPVYPLARKLWLNQQVNYAASSGEQTLYTYVYGQPQTGKANHKTQLESLLTANDFVTCDATTALKCGTGVCFGYDGGTALNDGRGTGKCQTAPIASNKVCDIATHN